MATQSSEKDTSLHLSSLRLLAPPLRLVSAAMWKVMKQRDVMHYGVLEEFVTSSCETVPGLLTFRHQAKLALGLRARLILELCNGQDPADPKVILPQLERIRAPTSSSLQKLKRDVKIEMTVTNFCELVQILLRDPTERALFYKDEFPVEYGPQFDQALEKLLWEFLIRVDQLLPVPNLAQTVSWLGAAPTVLEECARTASQPQLLKTLLQHQSCLGHLEPAASLPPCMGDSILSSMSLPPSGRVLQNALSGSKPTSVGALSLLSSSPGTGEKTGEQVKNKSLPITPVMVLISNKDLPLMASANERTECCKQDDVTLSTSREVEQESELMERLKCTGIKRRSKDGGVREEDEEVQMERNMQTVSNGLRCELGGQPMIKEPELEEGKVRVTRTGRRSVRGRVSSVLWKQSRVEGNGESEEEMESGRDGEAERDHIVDCMTVLGIPDLKLPEDPGLSSLLTSCLLRQPRVLISRLASADITSPTTSYPHSHGNRKQSVRSPWGRGKRPRLPRRSEHVLTRQRTLSDSPRALEMQLPGLADKENCAVSSVASCSSSLQRRSAESSLTSPGAGEDIIGDSEDEATKNFKGRLFVKRYYRTKHDTYVPTLREFWKPGHVRRDLLSPGNGHR